MSIKAPYLPYDSLKKHAEAFFDKYHPSRRGPVPIEHIVEIDFEIDIVPLPSLKDSIEVDAYISSDLLTIFVDKHIFERVENRYRFSLAHELAHVLIHAEVFQSLKFDSIGEWKSVMASIPEDQYSWLETQAYNLAGLMLVPLDHLEEEWEGVCSSAHEAGVEVREMNSDMLNSVHAHIGKQFGVSGQIIKKCLQ